MANALPPAGVNANSANTDQADAKGYILLYWSLSNSQQQGSGGSGNNSAYWLKSVKASLYPTGVQEAVGASAEIPAAGSQIISGPAWRSGIVRITTVDSDGKRRPALCSLAYLSGALSGLIGLTTENNAKITRAYLATKRVIWIG